MPKYAMLFHAEIEAPSQKEALEVASRVEDTIAHDVVLMETGDYIKYVKSFNLSGYDLLEEGNES